MYNKNLLKTIDYAVGLDLVMQMSNLIEYSSNYSKKNLIFGFYSKDESTNFSADIANDNNFKLFKYKAKLFENTDADVANRILKNEKPAVQLKYFWK